MSNQSKPGKHAAALPQTKAADVGESEAKAVAATNPEREEKYAIKNDLKQLKIFLVAKIEHGVQLISQQLRFEVTNLNQKIDANDARHTERMDGYEARNTERLDGYEAQNTKRSDDYEARNTKRSDDFEARINEKFDELRSDVDKQFEAKDKIDAERAAASEARIIERVIHIESMMKQVSEKNMYKIAFIVAAILAAIAAVYQFVIKVFM